MKKRLQLILSIGAFTANCIAQPSLTQANSAPAVGDIFVWKASGATVSPGSAGANQTWNLSGLTSTSTTNFTVMTAASTPSGSSFPSANVSAYDGSNYTYYNTSASSWLNYGLIGNGVVFSYSNPETMVTYPFNYTNSQTDAWQCTFTSGLTFTRTGTSTVTADGYGTATTPAGTSSNVMRLHVVQSYTDAATGFTLTYLNDEYMWIKPGNHYPIATVYTITTNGSSPTVGGAYLNNLSTGIVNIPMPTSDMNLFPNPAVNELNVNYVSVENGSTMIKLYNVSGQLIKSVENLRTYYGDNTYKLNVSDVQPGIYFLNLYNEGTLVKSQRFTVVK